MSGCGGNRLVRLKMESFYPQAVSWLKLFISRQKMPSSKI
jgi:hypothetical protein